MKINSVVPISLAALVPFLAVVTSEASSFQGRQGESVETIAVRPAPLTELEFEAKVLAFGMRSFSEHVRRNGLVADEQNDRLIELTARAQNEWIERSGAAAMEQLMNMLAEADWKEEERKVFATFANRIAILKCTRSVESEPNEAVAIERCRRAIDFAAAYSVSVGLGDMMIEQLPSEMREQWKTRSQEIAPLKETFSLQDLPEDVVAVLVNGVWHDRESQSIPIYKTPRDTFRNRVTLISNTYRPDVIVSWKTTAEVKALKRTLWISADSNCNSQRDIEVFGLSLRAVVPGLQPCGSSFSNDLDSTKQDDSGLIAKFGTQPPPFDPFKQEAPKESSSFVRPLLWGLISAAVVSGIVLSLQRNEERTVPVSHRGW